MSSIRCWTRLLSSAALAGVVSIAAQDQAQAFRLGGGFHFGTMRTAGGTHAFTHGSVARTTGLRGRDTLRTTGGRTDGGATTLGRSQAEGGRLTSTDLPGRGSNRPGGDRPVRTTGETDTPRWPIGHRPLGFPADQGVNPVLVSLPPNGVGPGGAGPTPGIGAGTATPLTSKRAGSGVPPAGENRYVPDEVVVEVATALSEQQIGALAGRFRLTRLESTVFRLAGTTLMRWRIPDRRAVPAVVRALEADGSVLSAQPNYLFALQDGTTPQLLVPTPSLEPTPQPAPASETAPHEGDPAQYVLDKMRLPQAHEIARGQVSVAVIDSGIDLTSSDLAGDIAGSLDAIGGTGAKVHPHGTAIAGAIAAHGRLMGAAPAARLFAVRAFSDSDGDNGTTYAIIKGLEWAVERGARVVNMSFAGPRDPIISVGLAAAHDQGVVLIAAAGNKGPASPPLFPAADRNVIAVTSTDLHDQLAPFANRGSYVAVAAPGVDLMLLAPGNKLQFASGTSFSAAYVTGTVALMLERAPGLRPDAVRAALATSAHALESLPGSSATLASQSGGGLADAYGAVLAVPPAAGPAVARGQGQGR